MKFSCLPSWLLAPALAAPLAANAAPRGASASASIRENQSGNGANEAHRLMSATPLDETKTSKCVIQVMVPTMKEDGGPGQVEFECEMDPADAGGKVGVNRRIAGSRTQMKTLKEMFEGQQIIPGVSELQFEGVGITTLGSDLVLGPADDPRSQVTKDGHAKKGKGTRNIFNGRRLANNPAMGDKLTLVVRVTDVNGLVRPEPAPEVGDYIFGTDGDPVNLKSQLDGCSMGKLNVVPGDMRTAPQPVSYAAPGVIDVTIDIDITTASTTTEVRNAVTSKTQEQLGFNLPGPYHQVLYILESCYPAHPDDCGWAAYAYIDSWLSVYQNWYYMLPSVLVHELGHNFNLAHSGGLDGQEYTDHSCMMGAPLGYDLDGRMCYNAAKNWQIGWYEDRKALLEPLSEPSDWSQAITLVGIADYLNNPSQYPVVVKLETDTPEDYFIGFNRATGVNSDNEEADDLVTITVTSHNGEGYAQSWLQGYIGQGQSYVINNFGGSAKNIVIEVVNIDIASSPGTAQLLVQTEQMPTASPTPNDFCNGQAGTRRVQVNLRTDYYPQETSWELINACTGATEKSSTNDLSIPYTGQNVDYMDQWCVPEAQYIFTIYDSVGDGICCAHGEGSYKVVWGSDVVASGGDFGSLEASDPFGLCDAAPTHLPTKQHTPNPTYHPTHTPTSQSTPTPTTQPTTDYPTPSPTSPITPNPTSQPTPAPSAVPTKFIQPAIPDGVILLRDNAPCIFQSNPSNHPDRFKCYIEHTATSNTPGDYGNPLTRLWGANNCKLDIRPVTWAWAGNMFIFESSDSLDTINACFSQNTLIADTPIPDGVVLKRDGSDCISQINPRNHPDRFKCFVESTVVSAAPGSYSNTAVPLVGFESCVINIQPVTWAWEGNAFIFESSASLDTINRCFVPGQVINPAGAGQFNELD